MRAAAEASLEARGLRRSAVLHILSFLGMPERRAAAVHVAAKLGALDEGVSPLAAREDDDGGRQGKVRYHACGSLPGSRLFRWDVWGWADHCRWFLSSAHVGPIPH